MTQIPFNFIGGSRVRSQNQPETALCIRMSNGITMLKMNSSPSNENQASYEDLPFFRRLTYSDKKPNPITSQRVKTVKTMVGVFMF